MKCWRGPFNLLWMVWLLGQVAGAQAQGKVALFTAAAAAQQAEVAPWLSLLERRLQADGYELIALSTEAAPARASAAALNEARSVGLSALNDLSTGAAGGDMLARYGSRVDAALALTRAVHDSEGRSLLWNLCVLRVQLLLKTGAAEQAVGQAARRCQRWFAEQRDFSRVWPPEVIAAFKRHAEQLTLVPLTIQSAPAGCEAFLYGAPAGTTPLRTEVPKGPAELQIRCAERTSRVHRVDVQQARDVAIRMDGDEALTRGPGGGSLIYAANVATEQAAEHANALANEHGADFFALVSWLDDGPSLSWFRAGTGLLRQVRIAAGMTEAEREAAVQRLFSAPDGQNDTRVSSAAANGRVQRHWADYVLGGGLVLGGVAGSVGPWLAFARDAECVNTSCTRVYDGRGAAAYGAIFSTAAAVSAGVVVLWLAPFGRHASYAVKAGLGTLQLRGTF